MQLDCNIRRHEEWGEAGGDLVGRCAGGEDRLSRYALRYRLNVMDWIKDKVS